MAKKKQAVVLIHGIGEQMPMDTLRGFIESVSEEGDLFYNKPDLMSASLELRRFQARHNSAIARPITDFYEYYWAHHLRSGSFKSVLRWLATLLGRFPSKIPRSLKPVYFFTWGSLLLLVLAACLGLLLLGSEAPSFREGGLVYFSSVVILIGFLASTARALSSSFVLGVVADAARYLTPAPENIEARNKIRAEGIKLLRALHESGRYFRIIVVGHSLGSVIGYDIIRNLWVDLRKPWIINSDAKQPLAKTFDEKVLAKIAAEHKESGNSHWSPEHVATFRQEQHNLWLEHRAVGIPWLVTDFITLGSPLAHAGILLDTDRTGFEKRKREWEYPTCPPAVTHTRTHYSEDFGGQPADEPITETSPAITTLAIPHGGAPFAATRWTNLYFPYRRLVFGDLVGGPLAGVFGEGIRDIPVQADGAGFWGQTLASHCMYWHRAGKAKAKPTTSHRTESPTTKNAGADSLEALRASLFLNCFGSKQIWPAPSRKPSSRA